MKTDFSKIAIGLRSDGLHSGTIDAAINLSKVFDCTLHLICFDDNCSIYEKMIEEKAQSQHVKFDIVRKSAESLKAIIAATNEIEADLLIVPADKNSQNLINALEIPVLTVKDEFTSKPVKHIVMPIHDKPETRQKVPVAVELAKHFGAVVDIVAIYGNGHEEQVRVKSYANQTDRFMTEKGIECTVNFVNHSKVPEATIQFAKENDADLIIIMNDRDAGFFSTSFSEKIIRDSPVPVITVEPKDLSSKGFAGL